MAWILQAISKEYLSLTTRSIHRLKTKITRRKKTNVNKMQKVINKKWLNSSNMYRLLRKICLKSTGKVEVCHNPLRLKLYPLLLYPKKLRMEILVWMLRQFHNHQELLKDPKLRLKILSLLMWMRYWRMLKTLDRKSKMHSLF